MRRDLKPPLAYKNIQRDQQRGISYRWSPHCQWDKKIRFWDIDIKKKRWKGQAPDLLPWTRRTETQKLTFFWIVLSLPANKSSLQATRLPLFTSQLLCKCLEPQSTGWLRTSGIWPPQKQPHSLIRVPHEPCDELWQSGIAGVPLEVSLGLFVNTLFFLFNSYSKEE